MQRDAKKYFVGELYVPTISVFLDGITVVSDFADITLSSFVLPICLQHIWNYAEKLSQFPEYSLYIHSIDLVTLTHKEQVA